MRFVIALDGPPGDRLEGELRRTGHDVARVASAVLAREAAGAASRTHDALTWAEVLVVPAARDTLTAELVRLCDRCAVRIVPLGSGAGAARLARAFGLSEPLPVEAPAPSLLAAVQRGVSSAAERVEGRVTVVWGPHGAPGRTTLAIELAVSLSDPDHRTALIDADTHAPAIAVALGLPEDSPGIAAACRRAADGIDAAELTRISVPVPGTVGEVDVLTGLNSPSRWPELSAPRLGAVLDACRHWARHTVVDVGAALERDEEIVSDLDGPRRNAATLTALQRADRILAVASADPVGIGRFIRAHAELRAIVGATPVHVVVNRLRTGALGIDARGQVRRTLERFAGITDVSFVPHDQRAADAALLAARPAGQIAPRSALSQSARRLAARGRDVASVARTAPEPPAGRRSLRRRAA